MITELNMSVCFIALGLLVTASYTGHSMEGLLMIW